MKIVMMGSGGVGGYFGARLADGGADVHFVARGAHLAAMLSQGLSIEGGPAPLHLPEVQATDDPASIGTRASAGCLRVSAAALWVLKRALRPGTPVVIHP